MSLSHLVLGGGGFIGREVACLLARRGEKVTIVARRPVALPEIIAQRHLDLRALDGEAAWTALLRGFGVVHHYVWNSVPLTAERDPADDLRGGLALTLSLLQALRRLGAAAPRLVFASSGGAVYGPLRRVPASEEEPLEPLGMHGAGKAAAELYIGACAAQHGLDCRIARIANPYGPGQDGGRGQGAVAAFAARALSGQPVELWGNGEAVRDYLHVADLAKGLARLACQADLRGHRVFNLGSGRGVSLNALLALLGRLLGREIAVRRLPARTHDVPVSVLDTRRAEAILGWRAKISLEEGLRELLRARQAA